MNVPSPTQLAQCRVCTNFGTQLVPFAGTGNATTLPNAEVPCSLPDAILTVGGVQVRLDDGLPQHCCVGCVRQVEAAYRLRRMCQESDRKLREQVVARGKEDDVVEVKPEREEKPEVEQMETRVEAGSSEQLVVQKEELDIDDDGMFDEDSNLMEMEENPSEAEHVCYERVLMDGFFCCSCKISFLTKHELVAHRDVVHIADKRTEEQLEYRVQCDVCYKVISTLTSLRKHQQRATVEFRCKTCGETFANQKRVIHHHRIRHVTGTGICCGCKEVFKSSEELKAHSEMVHLPKRGPSRDKYPFVCEVCYAGYATEQGLYAHQTRQAKEGSNLGSKFPCNECEKTFESANQLRQHKKNHDKLCVECGQAFKFNYELYLHQKTHKKNRCSMCLLTFPSHEALLVHVDAHKMPNRTFKCLECGQFFQKSSMLSLHSKVHVKSHQ